MKSNEESVRFPAAIRGYHFYRSFWRPVESEKLICMHELNNAFDRFAIKTVSQSGSTVGHLPMELSRVTKFYLDRGASVYAQLSSTYYRRSPLVQGGLEIPCIVVASMPATVRGKILTEKYIKLVHELYAEPKDERILGSFLNPVAAAPNIIDQPSCSSSTSGNKINKGKKASTNSSRDIREMMKKQSMDKEKKTQEAEKAGEKVVIELE